MLNYLWGYMILIGIGFGILTGEVEALSNAAIDSTGEAVTMAITMLGIMSMWTGLIEIAKRSGLLDQITRKLDPVLHFLFPRIPKDHIAKEYISANIVANLLGLGWAATPMGLKAMKELAKIERERLSDTGRPIRKASDEMCTFLIINISSLQLIPVSTIAYRSQYGSVNPAAVVFPGLIATTLADNGQISSNTSKPFSRSVEPVSTISTITSDRPTIGASSTDPFSLMISTV